MTRLRKTMLEELRKMGVRTVGLHTAALRFFFCKTLKRNYPVEEFPYPKRPRQLPTILSQLCCREHSEQFRPATW